MQTELFMFPWLRQAGSGGDLRLLTLIALGTLCVCPAAWSQSQPPAAPVERSITLQQALEMAARQNLDLMAARQRRAFALAGIRVAREIPNPNISVSVSRDPPHEGFLITQPLELGGKRARRTDLARQEQALTDVEITTLEHQVRRQTREAYFSTAKAHEETARLARVLALSQRLLDIAKQRFDAGDVSQLEVNQAQLEVARAEVDLRVGRQQESVSQKQLSALLNEPAETVWKPATSLDEGSVAPALEELVQRAYQSNAELAHLEKELSVEQSHANLLRAQRVPDLDLSAGLDLNAPHEYNVGPKGQFALNLPVFSRNQGELEQSSAQQRFLELQSTAVRRTVAGEVQAAYSEWDARRSEVELYRNSLRPAAERVEQQAEESYRAGKVNLLTVLDAQRSVQEIEKNYLESLSAMHNAFAALEEITGTSLD